jgi:hypothetical protein
MTRLCPCGNAITRPHGKLCEVCRQEKQSAGGKMNRNKTRNPRRYSIQTGTVMVKAKCLKCEGSGIHMVAVRKDTGKMLYEFCPTHSGLRKFSGDLYQLPGHIMQNTSRRGASV